MISFSLSKFSYIKDLMSQFYSKIAIKRIQEWGWMSWHNLKEVKTCFAGAQIGKNKMNIINQNSK